MNIQIDTSNFQEKYFFHDEDKLFYWAPIGEQPPEGCREVGYEEMKRLEAKIKPYWDEIDAKEKAEAQKDVEQLTLENNELKGRLALIEAKLGL
ncbi:hypothetical protein [Vibrio campbellii]|uniref:hypothetical protein n=1 Tax=Vibrio campbellii TaxID=680 RepID=UPI000CD342CB|nr:hypothetical protein [Vibrio campbellii]AUW07496.1 hypothetical protein C1N51_28155 [Vibrio campbellii]